MVSWPGKDILYNIDNPMKLFIDGYSYQGYLTNWLITQTNIFNAALSDGGAIEYIIDWGNKWLLFMRKWEFIF